MSEIKANKQKHRRLSPAEISENTGTNRSKKTRYMDRLTSQSGLHVNDWFNKDLFLVSINNTVLSLIQI